MSGDINTDFPFIISSHAEIFKSHLEDFFYTVTSLRYINLGVGKQGQTAAGVVARHTIRNMNVADCVFESKLERGGNIIWLNL